MSSCFNRDKSNATSDLNKENLEKYLKETFDIELDTLTAKLVLINYIGCKPCINMHLRFFQNNVVQNKESFLFVVPESFYGKFSQNCPVTPSIEILVDSADIIYRKNILIDGMSIYYIVKGEIQHIKTISINKISDSCLYHFWKE